MAGWVRADLAAGKISSEQAAHIFNELGTPADQRAPDTRSAEVKQLDAHFPPAKESEFFLHLYPPGQAPAVIPKEVLAFEANVRAWMGPDRTGLSREQGNSIITTLSKAGQSMRGLSANEREAGQILRAWMARPAGARQENDPRT